MFCAHLPFAPPAGNGFNQRRGHTATRCSGSQVRTRLDGSRHRGYAGRLRFPAFTPLLGIGAGTGRGRGVSGSATWPTRRGAPSLKEGAPSSGYASSCGTSSTNKWGSLLHARRTVAPGVPHRTVHLYRFRRDQPQPPPNRRMSTTTMINVLVSMASRFVRVGTRPVSGGS
jgi:hypothetical protein